LLLRHCCFTPALLLLCCAQVEATLSGIQTVMSAAQTEFVLGIEGCAILENMINIHDAEFREIYSDIGGFTAALLLLWCCFGAALLLLCCCFTAAR
jgi:hypothetical protein